MLVGRAQGDAAGIDGFPIATRLGDLNVVLLVLELPRGGRGDTDTDTGAGSEGARTLPALEILDEQGGLGVLRRAGQFGVVPAGAMFPTSGDGDGAPVVWNGV